jgi:hemoglobin
MADNNKQDSELPYDLLGGEEGVRALCKAFYMAMDNREDVQSLRQMHAQALDDVEQKLFEYLSGWLGGPHLYQQKYGTICLTHAHKPFAIDEEARDQWLRCMDEALDKVAASAHVKTMLKKPMFDLANFIRNC